eukprot:4562156-Pleurochrysis_carterae.AAC.1
MVESSRNLPRTMRIVQRADVPVLYAVPNPTSTIKVRQNPNELCPDSTVQVASAQRNMHQLN